MVQAHAQQLLNQKEYPAAAEMPAGLAGAAHPLVTATHRLLAALDRLETALENNFEQQEALITQGAQHADQLSMFETENETLRTERAGLDASLRQLQSQYADLHQAASGIYGKLDDSIQRLNTILES